MNWVHSYCANQGRWDEIIGELFPKASLLKWGKTHSLFTEQKNIQDSNKLHR